MRISYSNCSYPDWDKLQETCNLDTSHLVDTGTWEPSLSDGGNMVHPLTLAVLAKTDNKDINKFIFFQVAN